MDDKTRNFLRLFGLQPDYTAEDLSDAYRTLAKLNHPDLNDSPSAPMRMVLLNEGYSHLQNSIGTHGESRKGDDVYNLYRDGIDIMRAAFEVYYGRDNDILRLKESLIRAKEKFSIVVKEHSSSEWFNDSIDKICSINKWLD
ncbi:MAG: J domain-containing protein [Spirochaetes bacterium]|nr:J domain-containing protein [Spirochaetota bacterium]MBN2771940.1 J domain-containing protein [Spirochaetota bacterium]